MNDEKNAKMSELTLTLIFNQQEDDDTRDRQARNLLAQSREWESVIDAKLVTAPTPDGARAGGIAIVGEILAKIAPVQVKDFAQQLVAWLKRAQPGPVKIKVGEREAEFPADTDPATLAQWILAVQATPDTKDGE